MSVLKLRRLASSNPGPDLNSLQLQLPSNFPKDYFLHFQVTGACHLQSSPADW